MKHVCDILCRKFSDNDLVLRTVMCTSQQVFDEVYACAAQGFVYLGAIIPYIVIKQVRVSHIL